MERRALLAMLVLSVRTNVRQANEVLEELNRGAREQTYPSSLTRAYRTIEHDARAAGLPRFADALADAKDVATQVLLPDRTRPLVEVLSKANAEFIRAADNVEKGVPHKLDETIAKELEREARRATPRPSRRPD